jgi:Fur family ferric uptake transcriptional regulator
LSFTLHQEERRQFERLLRQQRIDRIGDRLAVLEAFLADQGHLSAEGWLGELKARGVDLEPSFVAQTLDLLARFGLAIKSEFEGGPPRYEHQHLGEHHDHLICTACGAISEFHDPELEAMQERLAANSGFLPLRHQLQIYGLCHNCQAAREPTLPLAMASAGERVRVARLACGEELGRQLMDLGLVMGAEAEVISCSGGPLVLAVKGSRVALGRGAAHKIMVTPINK